MDHAKLGCKRSHLLVFFVAFLCVLTGSVVRGQGLTNQKEVSPGSSLTYEAPKEAKLPGRFVVKGLNQAQLELCGKEAIRIGCWKFTVEGQPGLLGKTGRQGDLVWFQPRFPLAADVVHRVEFHPPESPGQVLRLEVKIPGETVGAPKVVGVYPSSDLLPENNLKFYVHFSQPMRKGEIHGKVKLLDGEGKALELPFLQLDEELWDTTMTRATLLLDPGRIKRGVQGRMEEGTIFQTGKEYQLVIDGTLSNSRGAPLGQNHTKKFKVGPAIHERVDAAEWSLAIPKTNTAPLVARFPRPLDHALLQHALTVHNDKGDPIKGKVTLGKNEASWEFLPESPWVSGNYHLKVGLTLEDLAGNRPDRAFDAPPGEGNPATSPLLRLDFRIK